jgi:hypothetical protein
VQLVIGVVQKALRRLKTNALLGLGQIKKDLLHKINVFLVQQATTALQQQMTQHRHPALLDPIVLKVLRLLQVLFVQLVPFQPEQELNPPQNAQSAMKVTIVQVDLKFSV